MMKMSPSILALSVILSMAITSLQAEAEKEVPPAIKQNEARPVKIAVAKFEPFTGKINKNKVRMRLQANYEGAVVRELNRDDLVIVLGQTDDFYSVEAPSNLKGYVYRTYVLDNIVEGDKVNIRLKPDREAIIAAQLKAGDRVDGVPAQANNKWLEINFPKTTRFYIAKEYVDKAGDVGFKDRLDKKRVAAADLLVTTDEMTKAVLQKPYEQMGITGIKANYEHIISDYPEFPDIVEKAKTSLSGLQEAHTAKKVAYLEEQSKHTAIAYETNKQLNAEIQAHKSKIDNLEQQIEQTKQIASAAQPVIDAQNQKRAAQLPMNMSAWLPVEEGLFNEWSIKHGKNNVQEFYDEQKQQGFLLKGIVDSYSRPLKNKPGDFMLINSTSKLPIAFLYSTHINLQDYVGHEVSIVVTPRNNNHFAFPAYFVLTLE